MLPCNIILIILAVNLLRVVKAFPDQGKWDLIMTKVDNKIGIPKSLFKGSQIFIKIICNVEGNRNPEIEIQWSLTQSSCWEDYVHSGQGYYTNQLPVNGFVDTQDNQSFSIKSLPKRVKCSNDHIILDELKLEETPKSYALKENIGKNLVKQNETVEEKTVSYNSKLPVDHPIFRITKDGVYLLVLQITSNDDFQANVGIEMQGTYGYLSAADWPLLPFYGAMCLVYVILGLIWLLVSFLQWRDLLRIQFWISGVIVLGMLEKAMFYAEYQSINSTGWSVRGAVLLAEIVSCGKRTLARMLVIIVSLGFGIVKPRLGPMLHRVVGTGTLYFILASVESYLRVMHPKNDPSNQILVASIPLAVLDSAICWWIFTSLVQTTRTLRLRRNMVKLSLYKHFTNTLIFAVAISVVFMLYSIKAHRLSVCLTDWKELWVDEAFWHVLFSSLLLVIMILWRPTNNNQRYAFTPLLDNPEDDDDDDEDDQFVSDAFGVKMRGYRSASPKPRSSTNQEDDLRWVEENIPASMGDATLPILDSDEEIMNTKFEVSKMQ